MNVKIMLLRKLIFSTFLDEHLILMYLFSVTPSVRLNNFVFHISTERLLALFHEMAGENARWLY